LGQLSCIGLRVLRASLSFPLLLKYGNSFD